MPRININQKVNKGLPVLVKDNIVRVNIPDTSYLFYEKVHWSKVLGKFKCLDSEVCCANFQRSYYQYGIPVVQYELVSGQWNGEINLKFWLFANEIVKEKLTNIKDYTDILIFFEMKKLRDIKILDECFLKEEDKAKVKELLAEVDEEALERMLCDTFSIQQIERASQVIDFSSVGSVESVGNENIGQTQKIEIGFSEAELNKKINELLGEE
jgi:hypothetical protein